MPRVAKRKNVSFTLTKKLAGGVGRASWSARIPITKLDEDKQQAFGWASIVVKGGAIVIDHDTDVIPIPEIENAAYGYVLEHRVAGLQHEEIGVGRLIESVVLTPEKPLRATDMPDHFNLHAER